MSEQPEFVLDRVFDAPRELVWRAWTTPEFLQRWYGPGAETTIHKFDLEPGGLWLNEMKWGDNSHFQKVVFQEASNAEITCFAAAMGGMSKGWGSGFSIMDEILREM